MSSMSKSVSISVQGAGSRKADGAGGEISVGSGGKSAACAGKDTATATDNARATLTQGDIADGSKKGGILEFSGANDQHLP